METIDLAAVFKALSNPHRLRIVMDLWATRRDGPQNVCCIANKCSLALSTVSHHIKELRQAGLIECKRDGKNVICTLNPKALDHLRSFVDNFSAR